MKYFNNSNLNFSHLLATVYFSYYQFQQDNKIKLKIKKIDNNWQRRSQGGGAMWF